MDRTVPPTTTLVPGALPGAAVASQRVTTVTITGWDPATRAVTFTGPSGANYTRRLLDTTDATVIAGLKVGDRVDVTRTEALQLAVLPPTQTQVVATPAEFENRYTISFMWGVDNQFSGKLIQPATGQTASGLPINLGETTFDDVYGRLTNFKFGFGYRTTPRSEAVFNFVISRNSADPVNIGTVGAANVPLNVEFSDLDYWGVEGGQRFYFARTRFTPYVGYLVGINRYDDVTGIFEGVPLELTPGLAEQDGKFFEKSWAASLGPTGGVLDRPRSLRDHGGDPATLHGWTVGCRLARRGGLARHQQRELALVVAGADRRQDSVLIPPITRRGNRICDAAPRVPDYNDRDVLPPFTTPLA